MLGKRRSAESESRSAVATAEEADRTKRESEPESEETVPFLEQSKGSIQVSNVDDPEIGNGSASGHQSKSAAASPFSVSVSADCQQRLRKEMNKRRHLANFEGLEETAV